MKYNQLNNIKIGKNTLKSTTTATFYATPPPTHWVDRARSLAAGPARPRTTPCDAIRPDYWLRCGSSPSPSNTASDSTNRRRDRPATPAPSWRHRRSGGKRSATSALSPRGWRPSRRGGSRRRWSRDRRRPRARSRRSWRCRSAGRRPPGGCRAGSQTATEERLQENNVHFN